MRILPSALIFSLFISSAIACEGDVNKSSGSGEDTISDTLISGHWIIVANSHEDRPKAFTSSLNIDGGDIMFFCYDNVTPVLHFSTPPLDPNAEILYRVTDIGPDPYRPQPRRPLKPLNHSISKHDDGATVTDREVVREIFKSKSFYIKGKTLLGNLFVNRYGSDATIEMYNVFRCLNDNQK